MKIDFGGRTWQLDTGAVTLKQAEAITGDTGLSLSGWEQATLDHEGAGWLKAIRWLYWLMLAQNGEDVPVADVDFEVLKFFMAWAEAAGAEARETGAEPEDPTKPAGEPAEAALKLPPPTSAG